MRLPGDVRRALVRRARRLSRWIAVPIELLIVDDAAMTELNARHRGEAKTTDVLSFAPEVASDLHLVLPGQIAISWDAVRRQAPRIDVWAHLDEASSLLVHGAAHLAGHDHHGRGEARAMLALERRLARRLGLTWLPRPYGG